jgi:hypothetical protein
MKSNLLAEDNITIFMVCIFVFGYAKNCYWLLWQNEFNLNMSSNFSTAEWNLYLVWMFMNRLSDYGYMSLVSIQSGVSCSPLLQWLMFTFFISDDLIWLRGLDYCVTFTAKGYKAHVRLTIIMREYSKCVSQQRRTIWIYFRWVMFACVSLSKKCSVVKSKQNKVIPVTVHTCL